jgi:hypothetical protein
MLRGIGVNKNATDPKSVSKEEFDNHIKHWPRPLVKDCYAAFDPPMISYNDFTYGYWPESIVAAHSGSFAGDPEGNWRIFRDEPWNKLTGEGELTILD